MIWCVEDDPSIREIEVYALNSTGLEARGFADGEEFWEALETELPELVLLDVMLPGEDGVAILKRLHSDERWRDVPVIMATAKGTEFDKVQSLDLGADDYITKPFSPSELVARVDAVYRRVSMSSARQEPENELRSGPFLLNIRSRSLTRDGQKIDLTQVEFQLMEHFMRNPNVALDRNSLLTTVWGDSYFGDDKIVDVNVRRLRMKIEPEPSNPKYLTTVWGFGYKWVE